MLRYRSLANYLVSKDHKVDVIGYYDLENELENGICYIQIKKQFSFGALVWFLRLLIAHLYLFKNMNLSRYLNRIGLAAITLALANKLNRANRYESCLISIAPWAYYMIVDRIRKDTRVIVDICDPLYKNAIYPGSDSDANLRLEKRALEVAGLIITVNEPSITIMTGEMRINPNKIRFISPAIHIDQYLCGGKKQYCFCNPISMIYSGSLYEGYRDLNEFIPALESCGGITLDVYTGSKCRPKDTSIVRVHEIIPHQEIVHLYQKFDLLLFVDNFYGYQVPSKIFELIAQNKPIIFVYDKRNVYFYNLLKNQEGIVFVENDRKRIKEALQIILSQRNQVVNYTIDLSKYSEETINNQLYNCIIS